MYANSNKASAQILNPPGKNLLLDDGESEKLAGDHKIVLGKPVAFVGYTVSMNALFQNHLDIEFLVYCLDSKRNHKLLQNPSPSAMLLPRLKNNSSKLILTAAQLSCLQGRGKLAAHSLQCGFMGGFRNIHISCKIRMAAFFSITHALLHIRFALWESNMASHNSHVSSGGYHRDEHFLFSLEDAFFSIGCELGFTPQ